MKNNQKIENLIIKLVAESPTEVNEMDLIIDYLKTLTKEEIIEFVDRSMTELWEARFDGEKTGCKHEETYASVRHESGLEIRRCKKCNYKIFKQEWILLPSSKGHPN
jgi:hypothetical protein